MTSWHTLGLSWAAVLIALSLAAGCGGQSDSNGSTGGSGGQGGAPAGQGGAPAGHGGAGGGEGGAGGCVHEGQAYRIGESFKADCNTCTCLGANMAACTTIACTNACDGAQSGFTNAIEAAKLCDPALGTEQCTLFESGDLTCGCPTFVNPANGKALMDASSWRDIYARNQCGQGIICGACLEPSRGFCSPSGVCQDVYDMGGASCLVNGRVYSHGATGIKDPFSCNVCQCNNGVLGCTEIGCQTPCPLDTTRGQRCAQCGFADGCDIVETGCFPACDGACPNAGQACVDGVCSAQCG